MVWHQEVVEIATPRAGLFDVTSRVAAVAERAGVRVGLVSVFLQHTSASLVVQENADPAVLRDLESFFAHLVPETRHYEHADEGPDDMPAHVKTALSRTEQTLPLRDGRLALGTWQALYVWEHRARPHQRRLVVTVWGE
ncbi:MAG TPA: secondary thiamine-phosphate synthase enzyme YjbQ [Polyangiaceae bacterium]|nr:secondary thiamine-phosphate synthase enzyme YjbQ [Polyangiaceae bacterium]